MSGGRAGRATDSRAESAAFDPGSPRRIGLHCSAWSPRLSRPPVSGGAAAGRATGSRAEPVAFKFDSGDPGLAVHRDDDFGLHYSAAAVHQAGYLPLLKQDKKLTLHLASSEGPGPSSHDSDLPVSQSLSLCSAARTGQRLRVSLKVCRLNHVSSLPVHADSTVHLAGFLSLRLLSLSSL